MFRDIGPAVEEADYRPCTYGIPEQTLAAGLHRNDGPLSCYDPGLTDAQPSQVYLLLLGPEVTPLRRVAGLADPGPRDECMSQYVSMAGAPDSRQIKRVRLRAHARGCFLWRDQATLQCNTISPNRLQHKQSCRRGYVHHP
jgi:hypothetical protein